MGWVVWFGAPLGGLVKLKKIREKLGLARRHPPTPYPIFDFFLKHVQQQKTTQNTQKNQKKKKSELGLDPPTHFQVFLGFLDFFNLTKTP